MRLPFPKIEHPPEIYQAIIQEHQQNPVRMGEVLMACGWTLADAAWAAVNWDHLTMAVAVANERAKRNVGLTSLTEDEVNQLKKRIQVEQKNTAAVRPQRTTRIVATPQIHLRPPQQPPDTTT